MFVYFERAVYTTLPLLVPSISLLQQNKNLFKVQLFELNLIRSYYHLNYSDVCLKGFFDFSIFNVYCQYLIFTCFNVAFIAVDLIWRAFILFHTDNIHNVLFIWNDVIQCS